MSDRLTTMFLNYRNLPSMKATRLSGSPYLLTQPCSATAREKENKSVIKQKVEILSNTAAGNEVS